MEDMRNKAREWMEKNNLSIRKAAKEMGIGYDSLLDFMKNKATHGPIEKVAVEIHHFFSKEKDIAKSSSDISYKEMVGFVETSVAQRVREVASICQSEKEIGVVFGRAGVGKTTALKVYAEEHDHVVLLEVDPGYRPQFILKKICMALDISPYFRIMEMFDELIEKIKETNLLIIIDEAENLSVDCLEIIRRIHDKTGIGILLCGLPRLISNLRGRRGQYEQLYSRVALAIKVEDIDLEDTKEIVTRMLPDSGKLVKTFHEACGGNARVLSKLLPRAIKIAELNEMPLNKQIILETANMLIRK